MKAVPKKEKALAAALVCLTAAAVFGIKASQVQNDEILPVSAAGPSSSDTESSSSSPAKEKIPGEKAELHPTDAAQQLSSGQLELLYDFFDVHYEAMASLKPSSLADLFSCRTKEESDNLLLNESALELTCAVRAVRDIDLTMTDWSYGLTVDSVEKEEDTQDVTVRLRENCRVQFSAMGDRPSFAGGIEHTFVLTRENGQWRIALHDRVEDLFLRLSEQYEARSQSEEDFSADRSAFLFDALRKEVLSTAQDDEAQRQLQRAVFLSEGGKIEESDFEGEYDRSAAVEYSYEWVDPVETVRNTEEWYYFDGNCQNYVSQCLYAGGISMDWSGDTQWKCFGSPVNVWRQPYGRSSSWAGVWQFYDYCVQNEANGPAVQADANLYSGQPGDVLQYAAFGEWVHSVLVCDVLTDEEGSVLDLIINSNTTDRIDWPASAYGYSTMRLIRVLGDNG